MANVMFRVLATPYAAKDRQVIDFRSINLIDCQKQIDGYIFNLTVKNKYNINIFIKSNDKITTNSLIEVYCDCPSFKYQFETVLGLNKYLLGTARSKRLPKKQMLATCKHVQTCLKYLLNFRTVSNILDRL